MVNLYTRLKRVWQRALNPSKIEGKPELMQIFCLQVVETVIACHSRGVIHRDIKVSISPTKFITNPSKKLDLFVIKIFFVCFSKKIKIFGPVVIYSFEIDPDMAGRESFGRSQDSGSQAHRLWIRSFHPGRCLQGI